MNVYLQFLSVMRTKDPEKEVHRWAIWYGRSIVSVNQALSLVTLQFLFSWPFSFHYPREQLNLETSHFRRKGQRREYYFSTKNTSYQTPCTQQPHYHLTYQNLPHDLHTEETREGVEDNYCNPFRVFCFVLLVCLLKSYNQQIFIEVELYTSSI